MTRVAVIGGRGKTGLAVTAALTSRRVTPVPLGRADWAELATALSGCDAAYVIAPNLHPDEPAYVSDVLASLQRSRIGRVVYHSVASPYAPAMPHHLGKARSEDLVRRSGLDWTILQPGAYLQNLDLTGPVQVPYSPDVPFGFLDLADLGRAAAAVLTEPGHSGATYELASRLATVRELADEAGVPVIQVPDPGIHPWLSAMFAYYDSHGLPVGTRVLACLLR
jgi:NAD(P)H dehydrogenase (quinone)